MTPAPREGTSEWWKDADELKARVDAAGGFQPCSRVHNGKPSDHTLRRWWTKHGLPPREDDYLKRRREGGNVKPGKTTLPPPDEIEIDADSIDDIEGLLRERGMRMEDWIIVRCVVNKWEGFYKTKEDEARVQPLRQLKVSLRPRISAEFIVPATVKPLSIPKRDVKRPARASRLVFIYGDDQRPNVDRGFEACKLQWLKANQPDTIIDLGDGMDLPTLSGHKPNPANNWSVQQCVDDYATWLYAARSVSPNSEFVILAANHDQKRLRDYQLDKAASLYGVTPADVAGLEADLEPLMSFRRLLRLDEMGIEFKQPVDDTHYAESQYEIVPGRLVALHGYRTGNNVGKKLIDDYGCSVIYGHVHGQEVHVTDWRRRGIGTRERLYALGVGCGAVVAGGIGFAPGADWQNSCLTISVFPDGGWTFEYANFEDGVLRWRDQEYRANERLEEAA